MNEDLPEGFKMTELGPLPEEWEVVKFSDCRAKQKIKIPPSVLKSEYRPTGKYPIVDQSMNFIAGYTDENEKILRQQLPVVIFGDHTRIFKFVDFPFAIGADGTKIIFPKTDTFDPKFLYYYFLNLKIPSKGYNRHFKLLKESIVVRPPLPEQRAIANVLSTVQDAKEKTEQVIKAAKELKKSLMKYLFTYGPVPLNEAENVPLKETEIGMVPEEWGVVRLGDMAKIKYGKAKPKDSGNVPVVGSGGIYSTTDKALVTYPTIVIGRKGTAGKVWLFLEPCYPSDTTFYLEWKENIDVSFLFNYMCLNPLSGEHAKTTLPSLQKPDLENLRIPFPHLSIQQKIASILSAVDEKIQAEENKKRALEELFKSMLHNLMTGKIRVKDLDLSKLGYRVENEIRS